MTREEKIKILEMAQRKSIYDGGDRQAEALTSAIKVLKQEPCEDAISRQAMHIELEKWITYGEYKYSNATKYLYDRIDRLQPVNPQEPKTGHWIRISPAEIYECSECGQNVMTSDICAYKFCHGCSARMVEPQEREDKA